MKYLFLGVIGVIATSTSSYTSELNVFNAIIAQDTSDREGKIYRSFRTASSPFIQKRVQEIKSKKFRVYDPSIFEKEWDDLTSEDKKGIVWNKIPTREGLDKQHVSGSSQFGAVGFASILKDIENTGFKGQVVVVDHREEPHFFINEKGSDLSGESSKAGLGVPFTFFAKSDAFNLGKTWSELERVEAELIDLIANHDNIFVSEIMSKKKNLASEVKLWDLKVGKVFSEKYLVKDLFGAGYSRIGITDHHKAMDDDLDEILKLFDTLPIGVWKHFHCRGGKGRTTTGMILFDILANHNNLGVSFEDIMIRQYLIGGSNLLAAATTDSDKKWKAKAAYDRIRTIYKFYTNSKNKDLKTRSFYANNQDYKDSTYVNHAKESLLTYADSPRLMSTDKEEVVVNDTHLKKKSFKNTTMRMKRRSAKRNSVKIDPEQFKLDLKTM